MSGTVNPNGQATTWWVEYGTSTSYGSKTANVNAGSGRQRAVGDAPVARSRHHLPLPRRREQRRRHGRGGDGIFTTSAAPAVVTGAATSVAPTSATLNGSVDPNGRATTWYFEYGRARATARGRRSRTRARAAARSPSRRPSRVSPAAASTTTGWSRRATRDESGADQTFATYGAPAVTTDVASSVTPTGAAERDGHPERAVHELVLRLRHEHELRHADNGQGRRLGDAPHAGERLADAAAGRRHLPLPARGDERSGTTVGRDRMFSTALQPVVRTDAARDLTATTVTLTGSVDPRTRATSWWFEYGTTTGYGSRTPSRSAGSIRAGR